MIGDGGAAHQSNEVLIAVDTVNIKIYIEFELLQTILGNAGRAEVEDIQTLVI